MKDIKEKIHHATYLKMGHKKQILSQAEDISKDLEKSKREKEQLCKICYYRTGIVAGQGFTHKDCESCDKTQTFPTTYTDKLCKPCAESNNCCRHCMAKMEY